MRHFTKHFANGFVSFPQVKLINIRAAIRAPAFPSYMHRENFISISLHIEWNMIVVTVFLSILNRMEIHLVQNRKENCHCDHIPFNVKGKGNIVLSV